MIHNDILRRLRFALRMNDADAIAIFKIVDYDIDKTYLHCIMKREDEEGFTRCRDKVLSLFLDGLIISKRGRQENTEVKILDASEQLNNNEILRKIRIAMSYRDDDIIDILKYANFRISKGELSALFRKPDHRSYKPCGDQLLRNFLQGMVKKLRPETKKA